MLELGDTRLIIKECKEQGLLRNEVAYVLASALWESNRTMKPVEEAYWLSESWRQRNLRYYPWHGRGYVQITWEDNYKRLGERLGIDLTTDPSVTLKPEVAVRILVLGMKEGLFTGKKLSNYFSLQRSDYIGARRIVNGTDKAEAIAGIARDYEEALIKDGYGVTKPTVPSVGKWFSWLRKK